MEKKKSIILLFLFCFLSGNIYAQEVIVSSTQHNMQYLLYFSSLTVANKNTLKTILQNSGSNVPQTSQRFQWICNSTTSIFIYSDWRAGDLKYDNTTTRVYAIVDAQYDGTIKSWITSGKIKRIACYWEIIYNDIKKGLYHAKVMRRQNYIDYPLTYENKDWCLFVKTSTGT